MFMGFHTLFLYLCDELGTWLPCSLQMACMCHFCIYMPCQEPPMFISNVVSFLVWSRFSNIVSSSISCRKLVLNGDALHSGVGICTWPWVGSVRPWYIWWPSVYVGTVSILGTSCYVWIYQLIRGHLKGHHIIKNLPLSSFYIIWPLGAVGGWHLQWTSP